MNSQIAMENMTWEEIRGAIKRGFTDVVFSVASIEQHGPHLAISTDTVFGDETARRVAAKLGKTLVAPTIRPGFSPHHMSFPGTITLRSETLGMIIEDYCTSLAKHGFQNIIVICSHGGNKPTLQLACREVAERLPRVNIIPIYDVTLYEPKALYGPEHGFHANRAETSQMLYLRQELVRKKKIRKDPLRLDRSFIDPSILLGQGLVSDISRTGVLGDPFGANAREGEKSFSTGINNMVKEIRRLLK